MGKEMFDTIYFKLKDFDNEKPYCYYLLSGYWQVENIINTESKDGYIVQKVKITDNINNNNCKYYEAWKVENSRYVDYDEDQPDDKFFNSAFMESIGKKGIIRYDAEIYWIDKTNHLYKHIDGWKNGKVSYAGNLKSEEYNNCNYLHSISPLYIRAVFVHNVDFTDKEIIKENIKEFYKDRRTNKKEEFYIFLENELLGTKYYDIVAEIRDEWL